MKVPMSDDELRLWDRIVELLLQQWGVDEATKAANQVILLRRKGV